MFGRRKTEETRVRVGEHKKVLIVFFIVFLIYTLALLFVFGWILLNSLKTTEEYRISLYSFPKSFRIRNYIEIWETDYGGITLTQMFFNALVICALVPTVSCFVTSLAAYTLAKYKFKGNRVIQFLHILPMMFTIAGTQVSTYLLLDKLGLIGDFWGVTVMSAGASGMNYLLVYGTYKNISNTYMEAAEIDGANDFRIYFQIMLPQAMGIIGTLWMFGFIGMWNDYATVNLYMSERPTVAIGLETIRRTYTDNGRYDYPLYYAALVLSMIPIIILFVCFQKQIMKLSLGGGIKG